ncbi:uncharacterized protein CLUP02_06585 [Colletotrichum lupini]|uniref:Secreted protein n=1 Tax=Colletotrichum lupini TaxID=145971 RepID=A0A9Q8WF67_9PEZI|nr:uncharacterized protein CLUP02_06585 [Colletotrichum lupini]UQC81099.1 hypothetical protein CLUP02_06585 [Colletotrichum lupini]
MPQSGLLISLFLLISTHSVLVSLFSTKQAVPSNSTRCHSFHFLPSPPKSLPLPLPCLALLLIFPISPRSPPLFPLFIYPLLSMSFTR